MIALWMTYATLVALLACFAAVAAERALRLAKRPARAVWIGAMTLSCTIPLMTTRRSPAATELATATTAYVLRANDYPTLGSVAARRGASSREAVTSGWTLSALDRPLIVGWAAGSVLWLLMLAASATAIVRRRRHWTASMVDDVPVLVSRDVGPAVVGLVRPRIVIPIWVTTLAPEQRALVLAHEHEHARRRDPLVLAAGALALAAMPWNAALWYALSRLRLAVEADCDGRVLRTHPDVRAYSSLLVDVTERNLRSAMHLAALGDSRSQLARRLTLLTARVPRHRAVRVAGAAVLSVASIAVACEAPQPAAISRESAVSARISSPTTRPGSSDEVEHPIGRRSASDSLIPVSRRDIEEALAASGIAPDSMLTPRDIRELANAVRARRRIPGRSSENAPSQEPPPVAKSVIRRAVETYYPTALAGGMGGGKHYLWFTGDRMNRVLGHAAGREGLEALWVQHGTLPPERVSSENVSWGGVVRMVPGTPPSAQRRGDALQLAVFPSGPDTVVAVWARLWGETGGR